MSDLKKGQNAFAQNENSKVRIKVINDLCVSAAICLIKAPDTFELDDDGKAYLKEGTWDEAQDIIKAAAACPTTAIIIEDLKGNQIYPKLS